MNESKDKLTTLITEAREGDLACYEELVARFAGVAVGYAYALLGDFHLAEDAAQEAFTEAYKNLGKLRSPTAFSAWFRRIVAKQCDRLRRKRRISTVPLTQTMLQRW